MPKSVFKDDMEVRSFPSLDLSKGMTSPGKFGEGTRKSARVGNQAMADRVSKFHPKESGNLK